MTTIPSSNASYRRIFLVVRRPAQLPFVAVRRLSELVNSILAALQICARAVEPLISPPETVVRRDAESSLHLSHEHLRLDDALVAPLQDDGFRIDAQALRRAAREAGGDRQQLAGPAFTIFSVDIDRARSFRAIGHPARCGVDVSQTGRGDSNAERVSGAISRIRSAHPVQVFEESRFKATCVANSIPIFRPDAGYPNKRPGKCASSADTCRWPITFSRPERFRLRNSRPIKRRARLTGILGAQHRAEPAEKRPTDQTGTDAHDSGVRDPRARGSRRHGHRLQGARPTAAMPGRPEDDSPRSAATAPVRKIWSRWRSAECVERGGPVPSSESGAYLQSQTRRGPCRNVSLEPWKAGT